MNILVSPNAFKSSLSAYDAAIAIEKGLKDSGLTCTVERFPIGDGGDGTGSLLVDHLDGKWRQQQVFDPLGRTILSRFGLTDNNTTAVIEMSDASGIKLLSEDELDPFRASSIGTGQLILAALDARVKKIFICLGGSATVDGGIGILNALGAQFIDSKNEVLKARIDNITEIKRIDLSGFDRRVFDTEIEVLCDVDNPLLGKSGAAAVFGPQKGVSDADIPLLDDYLSRFAELARHVTGKRMHELESGGAAGGTAAALSVFLNARLVNGADRFLTLTGFTEKLVKADLLIVAEGSLDAQSLRGKAPFAVAKLAKERGIKVIGMAGKIPSDPNVNMDPYFDVLLPIGNEPKPVSVAMRSTAADLQRTARSLGKLMHILS